MTTTTSPLVNSFFLTNPNASISDVENTLQQNGGLTSDLASALAQHYGTDVNTVTNTYNNYLNSLNANKDAAPTVPEVQQPATSDIPAPTSNSPLTATTSTQQSPLTQLQGVQNTVNNLTNANNTPSGNSAAQFESWLEKVSAPSQMGYQGPGTQAILQKINELGIDPSQVQSLVQATGLNFAPSDPTQSFGAITKNAQIANALSAPGTDPSQVVGSQQYQALSNVLNSQDQRYAPGVRFGDQFSYLAQNGVTPAQFAAATGIDPKYAVSKFDAQIDPQSQADKLATNIGGTVFTGPAITASEGKAAENKYTANKLPVGTQYQYGVNAGGQPIILYTDPNTKQQMAFTNGLGGTYDSVSLASVPQQWLPVGPTSTYTFGQSSYVSPYNANGTLNTTSSAALDAAYKNGLLSASDYTKYKQALTKKSST